MNAAAPAGTRSSRRASHERYRHRYHVVTPCWTWREDAPKRFVNSRLLLGPDHHVHAYTSIPFDPDQAADFGAAGLDEIRFHLLDGTTSKYRATMEACSRSGIEVGVELPCEPDKKTNSLPCWTT